jgi:hypothetical protein
MYRPAKPPGWTRWWRYILSKNQTSRQIEGDLLCLPKLAFSWERATTFLRSPRRWKMADLRGECGSRSRDRCPPSGDLFDPSHRRDGAAATLKTRVFMRVPHDLFKLTTADENGRARWPYRAAFQKCGRLGPAVPTKTSFS